MTKKDKIVQGSIVGVFVLLYAFVSLISTIHVVDFFKMTNPDWLAICLAIAFEFGAAASLAAIVVGDKTNKTIVWGLFFILTAFQMQGNMWYAYVYAEDYMSWMELFALNEEDPIFQKRILAAVSGAVLPVVALGFIKSLVDYIRPDEELPKTVKETTEDFDEDHALDQVMNDMVEEIEEVEDKYTETETKEDLSNIKLEDQDVIDDLETFGEILNKEKKDDIETFGKPLAKKPEQPSLDDQIQQKRRIAQ